MTNPERMALLRALSKSPEIKRRFPKLWRVRRYEGAALRKLAASVGIDVDAVRAQVARDVAARVPRLPPPAVPPPRPAHPFRGTFEFPIKIEALGLATIRRVRIHWGYTPEWPHFSRQGDLRVDGLERCEFSADVQTANQEDIFEIDDPVQGPLTIHEWRPFDLFAYGLVGCDVIDRIFDRIDREARKQNGTQRRARKETKATMGGGGAAAGAASA